MNKVYGIDTGRSTFTAASAGGESKSFPNTESGYQDFMSWLGTGSKTIVVEGRGNGSARLCVLLRDKGHRVLEINPMTSGRLSEAMSQDKTDELDAVNIARMSLLLEPQLSEVKDDLRSLALRELGRELIGIKRDLNREINRLHRLLSVTYGPSYKKIFGKFNSLALLFYETFPSAASAREAGTEGLASFFREHGGKRYGSKASRARGARITELLIEGGHFPDDVHIHALCQKVKRLVGRIRLMRAQKEEVIDQINELAPDETKLLCSMKGVNKAIAAVIIAEMGGVERFKSARNMASYAGLIPAKHQSGDVSFSKTRSRFNPTLKWAFLLVGSLRARYDPSARAYYQKKLSEGKKPFQARAATARVQVDIIWSILTRGTPYV